MSKDGLSNRIFDHVDPSRREFVKRVLAGAAFAVPVVASFSIESLSVNAAYGQSSSSSSLTSSACNISGSCRCLADPGYVGPGVFQAYVEDVSGNTRVNGELTFVIRGDGDFDRDDRNGRIADVTLSLTKDAQVTSAYLTINGQEVANVQLQAAHGLGQHNLSGKITTADLMNLCDFDALLQAMASQQVVVIVQGTYSSNYFDAQGPVLAASGSPIIEIKA